MNTIQDLYFSKKDKKNKGFFNPEDATNILAGSKTKIDLGNGKTATATQAYESAGKAYETAKSNSKRFKKSSEGYNSPKPNFKNVEQEKAWNDGENIRKKWGTGLLGRAIAEVNGRWKYGQSYYAADKDVQEKRQKHREIARNNYDKSLEQMNKANKVRRDLYAERQKELKGIRQNVQTNSTPKPATKKCSSCGSLIPVSASQCPYCTAKVGSGNPKPNPNPNPSPNPKPQRPQPKNYDQNAAKQGMANAWKAGNGNEAIRIARDALKYDWSSDPAYLSYLKKKLAAMKAAMNGNGNNQIFSENFSLPSTKLDEAVRRFKEGAARANGTYMPTNETKEQRRIRMALAAERSKVGKPIIVGGIKYQAHSEEQNQQNEEDR